MTNPINRLAYVVGQIEETQYNIAQIEQELEANYLGNNQERSQTELRVILTQLKAYLGFLRTTESAYLADLNDEKSLRKAQNELSNA